MSMIRRWRRRREHVPTNGYLVHVEFLLDEGRYVDRQASPYRPEEKVSHMRTVQNQMPSITYGRLILFQQLLRPWPIPSRPS